MRSRPDSGRHKCLVSAWRLCRPPSLRTEASAGACALRAGHMRRRFAKKAGDDRTDRPGRLVRRWSGAGQAHARRGGPAGAGRNLLNSRLATTRSTTAVCAVRGTTAPAPVTRTYVLRLIRYRLSLSASCVS